MEFVGPEVHVAPNATNTAMVVDEGWSGASPITSWVSHPSAIGYRRQGALTIGSGSGAHTLTIEAVAPEFDSGMNDGTDGQELERTANFFTGAEENPTSAQSAPTPRAGQQTSGMGAPGDVPSTRGIMGPSSGQEPTWTPGFNPYSGHGNYNPFAGWSWPSFWPFGGGGDGGTGGIPNADGSGTTQDALDSGDPNMYAAVGLPGTTGSGSLSGSQGGGTDSEGRAPGSPPLPQDTPPPPPPGPTTPIPTAPAATAPGSQVDPTQPVPHQNANGTSPVGVNGGSEPADEGPLEASSKAISNGIYNLGVGVGMFVWDLGAVPYDLVFGTENSFYGSATAEALRQGASVPEVTGEVAANLGTLGVKGLKDSAQNWSETGDPTQFQVYSGSFLAAALTGKALEGAASRSPAATPVRAEPLADIARAGPPGEPAIGSAPNAGAVPRASVVGVPETSDVVTLWKAPANGRLGAAGEVTAGFDPAEYPGDGPYFATDKPIAEGFQQSYGNGLQEINISRGTFDELVHTGVIKMDGYYGAGRSWHVPADKLANFNDAVTQSATNRFHP